MTWRLSFALSNARFFFCNNDNSPSGVTHVSQVKFKYGSIISDDRSTEINSAKRYGVHPNYRRRDLSNDVALIQLKYPIRFNKVTRPICLPTKKLDEVVLRSFKYCVVSGFGDINKG